MARAGPGPGWRAARSRGPTPPCLSAAQRLAARAEPRPERPRNRPLPRRSGVGRSRAGRAWPGSSLLPQSDAAAGAIAAAPLTAAAGTARAAGATTGAAGTAGAAAGPAGAATGAAGTAAGPTGAATRTTTGAATRTTTGAATRATTGAWRCLGLAQPEQDRCGVDGRGAKPEPHQHSTTGQVGRVTRRAFVVSEKVHARSSHQVEKYPSPAAACRGAPAHETWCWPD
jgi:hypothetical protein